MSPKTSQARPALARSSLIDSFRRDIEAAESAGTDRDDMTLRLTLRDTANLRRDSSIPVADISFADGQMKVLDVRVVSGGVPVSHLDAGAAEPLVKA